MRHVPSPPPFDPLKFFGKRVRDTHGRIGHVVGAHVKPGNVVALQVQAEDGSTFFTDNEHATIMRREIAPDD